MAFYGGNGRKGDEVTSTLLARPGRGGVSLERALGSETRASIFAHLREVADERSVRDIAGEFDLHPNVARTHLQMLADAGLVSVGRRKRPGGGRPARIYAAIDDVGEDPAQLVAAPELAADPTLVVKLLASLLDAPGTDRAGRVVFGAGSVQDRARDVANAEGARLVEAAGTQADEDTPLPDAVAATLVALRRFAPAVASEVATEARDEAVIVRGLRDLVALLVGVRQDVATAFERGLLEGALRAAGARAVVEPTDDMAWRVRRTPGSIRPARPVATVDARDAGREAGVVEAMRAATALTAGEVLEVLTRGPGAPAAFARWADRAGHALLAVERVGDDDAPAIRLLVRKGS